MSEADMVDANLKPGRVYKDMHSSSNQQSPNYRIAYLDGLRCVAILAVVFYHFFTRWTPPTGPNLYPYGDTLSNLFKFGNFGVRLFFIISGFVITLTLFKCKGIGEFFVRRFARLVPAMLVCSILTFLVSSLVPGGEVFRVHPLSFLPSWTFVAPTVYNSIFSSTRFSNIDGTYWSLDIEMQFYLLVSLLYFANRRHFLRNFIFYSAITFLLEEIFSANGAILIFPSRLAKAAEACMFHLQLSDFLPWFLIGIGFFFFYQRKPIAHWLAPVLLGVAQLELSSMGDRAKVIEAVLIPVLFFMAMTNRTLGRVLSFKPLVLIGLSSYSLYLLHANVGVTLIRYFSTIFSLGTAGSVALAFAIASALVAFNYGLFQLYERRTNRYIVGVLLGKRNGGQPKANAS